jgi:hypothetical protein
VSLSIRNDSLDASLRKAEGVWRIENPVRERADSSAVEAVLRALASARVLRTVEVDVSGPEAYGLDRPRAEFAVEGRRLRLGAPNPARDGLYADRPPSRDVVLADLSLVPLLGLPLGRLRDRTALAFPAGRVVRLDVGRGDSTWTVERVGAGAWRIAELGVRADGKPVASLIDLLRAIRIHSFQDSLPFSSGGSGAGYGVVHDGGQVRIRIGAAVPETSLFECEASDRGASFRIARHYVDSLAARAGRLVDRRVLSGSLVEAESIRVSRDGSSFVLVRAGEGEWRIDAGEILPAYGPHARAFLRNLEGLRALDVLPPGTEAFPEHAAWMVEAGPETVRFAEAGGSILALRGGETGLLVLAPSVRLLLETTVGDLLEPAP